MPQLQLEAPQALLDAIARNLRVLSADRDAQALTPEQIILEALEAYAWATEQTSEGFAVVGVDANRSVISTLSTTHLPAREPTRR